MAKNASFLPEDYLDKRIQRRTNFICLTLFAIITAGVVGAFFVTDAQSKDLRIRERDVNKRFEEAAKRLEQLDELQYRKQRWMRKAKLISVLIERVPRSVVMAELINSMPTTLSLLEFELETRVQRQTLGRSRTRLEQAKQNANKTEPDIPELKATTVTINLVGVAPTDVQVAQYMTTLNQSELFYDVSLVFSEEKDIEDQIMRKFRIEMVLNQNIDSLTLSPKLVPRGLKQNPMSKEMRIGTDGQMIRLNQPGGQSSNASP